MLDSVVGLCSGGGGLVLAIVWYLIALCVGRILIRHVPHTLSSIVIKLLKLEWTETFFSLLGIHFLVMCMYVY